MRQVKSSQRKADSPIVCERVQKAGRLSGKTPKAGQGQVGSITGCQVGKTTIESLASDGLTLNQPKIRA